MTDPQPPNVVEGATTGDIDEEVPIAAKSAEDRKAAAALSSLDNKDDENAAGKNVDHDAVKKAMERLAGTGKGVNGTVAKKEEGEKVVKKTVKVDTADVTLLIDELELPKTKATDLLKSHEGDVVKAMRAYIAQAA